MSGIPIHIQVLLKAVFFCIVLAFTSIGDAEARTKKSDLCSALNQKPCPIIYPGEICDKGLDVRGGKCKPCGGKNERACKKIKRGYPCEGKLEENSKGICKPCGGKNQYACRAGKKGKQCNSGLFKDGSICKPCGGADEKACPKILRGYPCNGKLEPNSKDICKPCGGVNQTACRATKKGKQCNSGLVKDDGVCKECGGKDQVACPIIWSGNVCKDGLGKIDGKCKPCGTLDQAACPWTEHGRQCEAGTTESNDICRPCGGAGEIACKVTDRGKTCSEGTMREGGECKPCGLLDQAACPWTKAGRQCEEGTTESNDICRPCGEIGEIACKITDKGKTCVEGATREDGKCVPDMATELRELAEQDIANFASILVDILLLAENIDRSDAARSQVAVAEVNYNKLPAKSSGRAVYTVNADAVPDNNACLGEDFLSWSVGVGAAVNLGLSGYSGEAGLSFRCADHASGQKDSKLYSSGAMNHQLGGNASAGVTVGMWVDEFDDLSGDSYGYTLDIFSAIELIKVAKGVTSITEALKSAASISPEASVSIYREHLDDDKAGEFLGLTIAITGGVGIGAGGAYSEVTTVQFPD